MTLNELVKRIVGYHDYSNTELHFWQVVKNVRETCPPGWSICIGKTDPDGAYRLPPGTAVRVGQFVDRNPLSEGVPYPIYVYPTGPSPIELDEMEGNHTSLDIAVKRRLEEWRQEWEAKTRGLLDKHSNPTSHI